MRQHVAPTGADRTPILRSHPGARGFSCACPVVVGNSPRPRVRCPRVGAPHSRAREASAASGGRAATEMSPPSSSIRSDLSCGQAGERADGTSRAPLPPPPVPVRRPAPLAPRFLRTPPRESALALRSGRCGLLARGLSRRADAGFGRLKRTGLPVGSPNGAVRSGSGGRGPLHLTDASARRRRTTWRRSPRWKPHPPGTCVSRTGPARPTPW